MKPNYTTKNHVIQISCILYIFQDINFKFGIGGKDKKNSSSLILKDWIYSTKNKVWGTYYELFHDDANIFCFLCVYIYVCILVLKFIKKM